MVRVWSSVRLFAGMVVGCVLIAAVTTGACSPASETTSDDGDQTGSTQSAQGGTPSVASSTGVGAGGAGGNDPNLDCFAGYTGIPAGGDCDFLQQDCAPGFGCEPLNDGNGWRARCVQDTGPKGPGDTCVNDNSCRAGLHCVFNKCSPICCPNTDEPCGPGGICNVTSAFGAHAATVCSYLASCTLFTDDCDENFNCYPLLDSGNSVCAPTVGATVGEGMECDAINECNDSMVCVDRCRWACFLDGSNTTPGSGGCPAGQMCVPNGSNPPQNIGICQ